MGQTLGATAAATLPALGLHESLMSHMTVIALLLIAQGNMRKATDGATRRHENPHDG